MDSSDPKFEVPGEQGLFVAEVQSLAKNCRNSQNLLSKEKVAQHFWKHAKN